MVIIGFQILNKLRKIDILFLTLRNINLWFLKKKLILKSYIISSHFFCQVQTTLLISINFLLMTIQLMTMKFTIFKK